LIDEQEVWRSTHCSQDYLVSNKGRVKSLPRVVPVGRNGGKRVVPEKILSSWTCKNTGYLQVSISQKKHNIHRLVMLAFVGEAPDGCEVAHNDGRRDNANLSNLRWATRRENCGDMHKHGTSLIGHKNRMSKLTAEQVLEIRKDKRTRRAVAKDYGVTPEAISHIMLRKNWNWM